MSPKESIKNDRAVDLIKGGVEKLGVRGFARAVGISPAIVTRYMQGKAGEPSQATLQKLAAYFGVSVAWLRGGTVGPLERFLEGLKIAGIDPVTYNKTVAEKMGKECDFWGELVAGNALLNSEQPTVLCSFFGINQHWVMTGEQPTLLHGGGIVGTIEIDIADIYSKYVDLSNLDYDDYMRWGLQESEELQKYMELYEAFCKIPDENKEEGIRILLARLHVLSIRKSKTADPSESQTDG